MLVTMHLSVPKTPTPIAYVGAQGRSFSLSMLVPKNLRLVHGVLTSSPAITVSYRGRKPIDYEEYRNDICNPADTLAHYEWMNAYNWERRTRTLTLAR